MTLAVQGTLVSLLARAHQSRSHQCRDLAPMWGAFGAPRTPRPNLPTPSTPQQLLFGGGQILEP